MKTLTHMRAKINVLLSGPEGSNGQFQWLHDGWLLAALGAGLMLGGLTPHAFGQDRTSAAPTPAVANNPAPARHSSNRFLFVVDTSSAMKRQGDKERQAVENILRSGFNGQLHAGDTIGVWTFNDGIYTGRLGLQQWTPGDNEEIILRTTEFLHRQPYEKNSRFDVAMSAISKIVSVSDVITVVIVSDGRSPMTETPFDNNINTLYAQNLQDMKKTPEPMVTVLQGKGGQFTRQYSVAALPWPVVIPELPISVKVPKPPGESSAATAQASAPKAPARPAPQGPTMILVGPQPPEFPLPAQATTPAADSAPAPVPAPVPAPAAAPAPAPAPAPAIAALPAPVPAPSPVPSTPPVQQIASTPQPPEVVPASPGPAPVATPAVAPAPPSGSPVTAVQPPMDPAPYVNPPHPWVSPPRAASQPPIAPTPTEALPALTTPVVAQSPAPTPAPATAVVATEPPVNPAEAAPTVSSATVDTAKPATPAAPAPARPAVASQTGWLARSFTGLTGTSWMIGGVCLLVVGLVLMALFSKRSHGAGRVSLISQTLNK